MVSPCATVWLSLTSTCAASADTRAWISCFSVAGRMIPGLRTVTLTLTTGMPNILARATFGRVVKLANAMTAVSSTRAASPSCARSDATIWSVTVGSVTVIASA